MIIAEYGSSIYIAGSDSVNPGRISTILDIVSKAFTDYLLLDI